MVQQREQFILEELEKNGFVKVKDLSDKLNCSEVTIRNDIKKMDDEGLLQRTHGGAIKSGIQFSQKYTGETIYQHVDSKTAIAKKAYSYINDNDTIIIDDSSTSLYLTKHIKDNPAKHLIVVTHSLLVATELAEVQHVELFIVGGQIGGHLAAAMGDMTVNNLNEFCVDKAFIGVRGVNFKVGITSIAYPQMQVKKAIIRAANEVYVMADSSKFNNAYLSVVCSFDEITAIITDSSISREHVTAAREKEVSMIIAEGNRTL